MRLGDLDALKEDFKSRLADCNEWIEKAKDNETKIRASAIKAFISEVIMTIDNAPTVCGNNPKWCESCVSKGKCASTRPHMETKEAIKIIEKERDHCASHKGDFGKSAEYHKEMQDMVDAFDIAIKVLKREADWEEDNEIYHFKEGTENGKEELH